MSPPRRTLSVQESRYSGTKGWFYEIVRELQRHDQSTDVWSDLIVIALSSQPCNFIAITRASGKNAHLLTKAGKLAEMIVGINRSRKTPPFKAFNSTCAMGNLHPQGPPTSDRRNRNRRSTSHPSRCFRPSQQRKGSPKWM
jgi:hypothetical protein